MPWSAETQPVGEGLTPRHSKCQDDDFPCHSSLGVKNLAFMVEQTRTEQHRRFFILTGRIFKTGRLWAGSGCKKCFIWLLLYFESGISCHGLKTKRYIKIQIFNFSEKIF